MMTNRQAEIGLILRGTDLPVVGYFVIIVEWLVFTDIQHPWQGTKPKVAPFFFKWLHRLFPHGELQPVAKF